MASSRPSPTSSANENRNQFPENHRGTEFTEKTQSHLSSSLEPIFLNAKTQRREGAKPPAHPQTQRRGDAEAQRGPSLIPLCGEVPAVGRRPETAGPANRSKNKLSPRFPGPAACAQGAQASPPFFFIQ